MGTPHTKPRIPTDTGERPPWTHPEIDHVLNALLRVDCSEEFVRVCFELSQADERGDHTDHSPMSGAEPVKMKLWKIATRYYNHDYTPHPCRVSRAGQQITFAEDKVLVWAFKPTGDGARRPVPPTVQYIARVLCRSTVEIRAWWEGKYGGLGLRKAPEG